MKNLKSYSVILLMLGAGLMSCQKEKTDSLPAPAITTINQGNGVIETLQRQPNGSTVVFSNWITKVESDWTGFGTTEIKTSINTSSLTDAVRDRGLVLVYYEDPGGHVHSLPYTNLEFLQTFAMTFITGKIELSVKIMNSAISGIIDIRLRYILIPASSFGNAGSERSVPPVDYNNYEAVCAYYGLQQ
ncbi:MAG TPA: hypothetical protein VFX58_10555 [Chitinophagaceae bacterium]|nr:hypothetical protein [Chitinophagaceae bacterium]